MWASVTKLERGAWGRKHTYLSSVSIEGRWASQTDPGAPASSLMASEASPTPLGACAVPAVVLGHQNSSGAPDPDRLHQKWTQHWHLTTGCFTSWHNRKLSSNNYIEKLVFHECTLQKKRRKHGTQWWKNNGIISQWSHLPSTCWSPLTGMFWDTQSLDTASWHRVTKPKLTFHPNIMTESDDICLW